MKQNIFIFLVVVFFVQSCITNYDYTVEQMEVEGSDILFSIEGMNECPEQIVVLIGNETILFPTSIIYAGKNISAVDIRVSFVNDEINGFISCEMLPSAPQNAMISVLSNGLGMNFESPLRVEWGVEAVENATLLNGRRKIGVMFDQTGDEVDIIVAVCYEGWNQNE